MAQNIHHRRPGKGVVSAGVAIACVVRVKPQRYVIVAARRDRVHSAMAATSHAQSHSWSGSDVCRSHSAGVN